MTATSIESTHFVWHCAVAAMLLTKLPSTTARNSHLLHAVRKATVTAAGRKGVCYASTAARKIKETSGKDWEKCGLIKEHVIPVGEIYRRVVRELSSPDGVEDSASKLDHLLAIGDLSLINEHPTVKQIAGIVRDWTLLAWITNDDDLRLRHKDGNRGKSLHQSMPADWDGMDRFARYHGRIDYSEI